MTKIPPDDVLESFYELRIRESDQLKTVLEVYDMEIHQKISMPDYQKNWKRWWRESTDQKLRLRNFNARSERIETGALVVNRRVQRGVEGGPGECDHWKAKGQCPRGDNCSFRHDEDKRAKSTPKSAPPSEPPTEKDGRSTSRRKCLRGRSPSGKFARQPCRDFIKGKWTRPSCDYWHPPECQCYKFWIGMQIWRKVLVCTKAGWRSTLQKTEKGCDKNAVAILKDVRQFVCVFQDTEPPESSSISRKSAKVLGSIRRVQVINATQRHANIREKQRSVARSESSQKSSSAQSVRSKIWR